MNIAEAIKSGKKCKRRPWKKKWIDPTDRSHYINLTFDDLAANDWEVEEKQVTITESHFESAVARATQSFSMYNPPHICEYLTQLKKELGL